MSVQYTSICAQIESSFRILETASDNLLADGLHGKSLYEAQGKGHAHCSVNGCCSLPFISITSHQNSSPTEVATVPLAIKIMLGHAMVVCDSSVGNKSSGGSSSGIMTPTVEW